MRDILIEAYHPTIPGRPRRSRPVAVGTAPGPGQEVLSVAAYRARVASTDDAHREERRRRPVVIAAWKREALLQIDGEVAAQEPLGFPFALRRFAFALLPILDAMGVGGGQVVDMDGALQSVAPGQARQMVLAAAAERLRLYEARDADRAAVVAAVMAPIGYESP